MEKYYNDKEEVAVLYSPKYGAGWYSWNEGIKDIVFDKRIVQMILDGNTVTHEFMENLGYDGYWGGAKNLAIEWLPKGTIFEIEEYDGYESVHVLGTRSYLEA